MTSQVNSIVYKLSVLGRMQVKNLLRKGRMLPNLLIKEILVILILLVGLSTISLHPQIQVRVIVVVCLPLSKARNLLRLGVF